MQNFKKEAIDQAAHFIWALMILAPVALWPSLLSFVWAGFNAGLVREITEYGTPVTAEKVGRAAKRSWPDLAFWMAGGAGAYWVGGLV